jgi:hypothetical protein
MMQPSRGAGYPGQAEKRRADDDGRVRYKVRELGILQSFLTIYCRARHGRIRGQDHAVLCESCQELFAYASKRLALCPYNPKPKCKHCPTHCFSPARRAQIREVMRFSGIYFVKRGRLDWLLRYFLS